MACHCRPTPFNDAKARAVAWLTAWDSQGIHRTGTTGDEAGALWLARQAAGLGVDVTKEVFELNRLDPVACYLELDGERISGLPAFDAPATGATGVIGTLSFSGHDQAILVAQLWPRSVYTGEYERLRRDTAHRALLIVCTGARAGMGLLNAERFRHPYGAPTSMCRAMRVMSRSPVPHALHPPELSQKADIFRRLPATSSSRSVAPGPPLRQ